MSTFKIYSSKDNNAKNLGKKNLLNFRFILILLPVIGFIIAMINKIFHYQLGILFWIVYLLLILIVFGYSLILISRLKQIGIISFYEHEIVKKLGDFSENWNYDTIKGLLIKPHIRDIFYQKNKVGVRTFYLEIQFKDNKSQGLVISSVSNGTPAHGLRETLDIISKTRKIEIKK